MAVGLKNPLVVWLLAPFIVFVVISIIFKVAALTVHQKVDVYYKYRAGDLRLALWERLNRRLGLCLGLLNGAAYTILLSFVIYGISYCTTQVASDDGDPFTMRLVNRLGKDMVSSGFGKVARAVDPLPQIWYDTSDLIGLFYSNSLLEAKLARYPAFLGLAERQEFKDLGADKDFSELRLQRKPILEVYNYPRVATIIQNQDLLDTIWNILKTDMQDLNHFLENNKSEKYDEKILGRWSFDVAAAANTLRRLNPNMPKKEFLIVKQGISQAFLKTSLVAMPDNRVVLKNTPPLRPPAPGAQPSLSLQNYEGQWKSDGAKYQFSFSGGGMDQGLSGTIEGDRLTIMGGGMGFVFSRDD
jgi:hypothetical protein